MLNSQCARACGWVTQNPVETNSDLYDGDDRYFGELDLIASTLLGELIKFLQGAEEDSLVCPRARPRTSPAPPIARRPNAIC